MKTVAVIIGRFQVSKLHDGHCYLMNLALKENDALTVLIGTSEAQPSIRNPLSFAARRDMIIESFPMAKIFEIRDHPCDRMWSQAVDQLIEKKFSGFGITLYGSRDSFKDFYSGEFPVKIMPEIQNISGTTSRNGTLNPRDKESFRMGMIYENTLRYPTSYQVVDVGLVKWSEKLILLGRKRGDSKDSWRLPGGFVDPGDESLESAAARELGEEVPGVISHEFIYLGSYRIDDHRYRKEQDKIMTALFLTYHMGGKVRAGDDLGEIRWFPLKEAQRIILKDHVQLVERILEYIKINQ